MRLNTDEMFFNQVFECDVSFSTFSFYSLFMGVYFLSCQNSQIELPNRNQFSVGLLHRSHLKLKKFTIARRKSWLHSRSSVTRFKNYPNMWHQLVFILLKPVFLLSSTDLAWERYIKSLNLILVRSVSKIGSWSDCYQKDSSLKTVWVAPNLVFLLFRTVHSTKIMLLIKMADKILSQRAVSF